VSGRVDSDGSPLWAPVDDIEYVVRTNLPPEYVTAVGLEVFKQWADFAAGTGTANGNRIAHATGRYRSSISFQQTGEATVAVVADASIAPEAIILETGHNVVDLKTKPGFPQGRIFHSAMWAYPSRRFPGGSGPTHVTVGATGWVIPAMRAYAPAYAFARLAAHLAQGL
jgi:hypothetical protein